MKTKLVMAPILTETDDKLVVRTTTSPRSWAIFVGFVAVGIGAALYATDCCCWRIIFLVAGFAAGIWFLDDSEEVVFDKAANTVQVSVQKFFCTACCTQSESAKLSDISSVVVVQRNDKFAVDVTLVNKTSFTICDSPSAELDKTECRHIIERIRQFLQLDTKQPPRTPPPTITSSPMLAAETVTPTPDTTTLTSSLISDLSAEIPVVVPPAAGISTAAEPSDETSSLASSEESFERVTAADLAEYDAVIAAADKADVAGSGDRTSGTPSPDIETLPTEPSVHSSTEPSPDPSPEPHENPEEPAESGGNIVIAEAGEQAGGGDGNVIADAGGSK